MTTSTAKLVAALTPLDERVLKDVWEVAPAPIHDVVRELYPVTTTLSGATPAMAREVLEVLHGLERAECVRETNGVWHIAGQAPRPRTRRRR